MTHKERVISAIRHIEPDKVPKGELQIHDALVDKLLGIPAKKDYKNALVKWMTETISADDFAKQYKARQILKMDIVDVFPRGISTTLGKTKEGYKIIRDVWGNKIEMTSDSSKTIEVAIPDIRDADSYQFPPIDKFSFDNIEKWTRETDLFVTSQVFSAFNGVWYQLVGFENYMIYIYEERNRLRRLIEKYVEFNIQLAKAAVRHGADAIIMSDDLGFNTGTFLSPAILREMVFPYMRDQVVEIKKLHAPVLLHSCGNISEIVEDIVDIGFDGLHAMQPSASMNLEEIKRRYGDRLCLWGNLDIDRLSFSTPEEIETLTREAIKIAALEGGYILSSCNMLMDSIPPEIALAMYQTAEKYGEYPILLE